MSITSCATITQAPIRDSFEGWVKAAKPAVRGGQKPQRLDAVEASRKTLVMLRNVSKGCHIAVLQD